MTPAESIQAAGEFYIAVCGWSVFPIYAESRLPLKGSHGFKDATDNPAVLNRLIVRHLRETRSACDWDIGLGVATGSRSNLTVCDIDVKNGRDGFRTLRGLELELPQTLTQRTRSGGMHCLYAGATRTRDSLFFEGSGVDIKSEGGFVVVWPTRGYEFLAEPAPERLAPTPDWALTKRHQRSAAPIESTILPEYVPYLVERWCATVGDAPIGSGNVTLNQAAFSLGWFVGDGQLEVADVVACLLEATLGWSPKPGETHEQLRSKCERTIWSGLAARGVEESTWTG